MKAIWSGTISFGLVNIPVQLFSAVQEHVFGFRLLHKKCHTPLTYHRYCPHCKKDVTWDETVKGLEQDDGSYLILTKEEINELKPEKSDTIEIKEFVDRTQIQLIYIDSHYYMAPTKKAEKAFFLFCEALKQSGKVAVGQFVMREKEYVVAINPYKNTLLLNTLNYDYEIRAIKEVPLPAKKPKVDKKELKLAEQLIKQLTRKTFDLSKYKDTFAQSLKKAIKERKKGKKIKMKPKKAKHKKSASLTEALRASLGSEARA
jgi:DNA end-binding protein Ku